MTDTDASPAPPKQWDMGSPLPAPDAGATPGTTTNPELVEALRETTARLIAHHVREINRVIASGMHEGDAIYAAVDAILAALSQAERSGSQGGE